MTRPNVLLLTVDTLRADRLSAYGYGRPTTPALERLARDALVAERAYTLGPFTQIACIQLFTSSRPLSYGGYDLGATGRPDTVFKRFRDAGYSTWGLSTIHWVSPYYGYTDGLEEEVLVFLLNTLTGMAVNNMRDTVRVWHEGRIGDEEMLSVAGPVIRRLFDNVDHYARTMTPKRGEYRADFPDAKFVTDDYDFRKVARVAARHRAAFDADPAGYVTTHLRRTPAAHEWIAGEWRAARRPLKLLTETAFRAGNRLLGLFAPSLASLRDNRFRMSADAHAIARRVCGALETRDPSRPFFMWAHFKDSHQPYVAGAGRRWYRETPRYLQALGHPSDIDPGLVFRGRPKTAERYEALGALYDAAIRSQDEAVGRILDRLESLRLADNTVVGFCGDHGEELGEHGDYGHLTMPYEHNVRIPMMFRAPGRAAARLDPLVMSLDFAPTVASLAGIEPAAGWEGAPIDSAAVAARDHVLMENFCRGNCAFAHRPVYMAVRTQRYKYIWREYRDPTDRYSPDGPQLFDLAADPQERTDIYRPDHPAVAQAEAIIARRLLEIPEIPRARVVDRLGEAAVAAAEAGTMAAAAG